MRKFIHIGIALVVFTMTLACTREHINELPSLPDGTPVTLNISFGSQEPAQLEVGTKAESSDADEARVHDIYVFIFDASGSKIYGRFFSYEHLTSTLAELDANTNEGWFVKNKTLSGVDNPVTTTRGAVKVSTESCSDATLVLLANIENSISRFNDEDDQIAYLNGISTLDELRATEVQLEQDIVSRKDLFLKLGTLEHVNTASMTWGTLPDSYDQNYKVELESVDAKVKFLVKCNETNISAAKAVYWEVCNAPDRCYLFSDYNGGAAPDDVVYFDSGEMYFEGTETVDGNEWYVFSFYIFESRFDAKQAASSYYDREVQEKTDTGESGYHLGGNFVENGEWTYADPNAAYVKFDLILTLTPAGVYNATGNSVNNALTSDAIFTVHLGDFTGAGIDDYNTLRSHFYTYKVTVNNSGSIYAEVENDSENQAGQEGFLILTDDEIVNADCHYEYHTISFTYDPTITSSMFSWYVKTPFSDGQPTKHTDPDDANAVLYDPTGLDYLWVKFEVNNISNDVYDDERRAYPGDSAYDSAWKPSLGTDAPTLMDISQLIEFIFDQNRKKKNGETNLFDTNNQIKVTAFIDEFYYDKHPLTGELSEDLWRSFVNAKPREMHILSNARASRDQKSDVINSSHSIIQESIQTIYNIYAPGLRSLWGTEHLDEMRDQAWVYWRKSAYGSSADCPLGERAGANSDLGKYNGRLNTAYMWYVYDSNNANGKVKTDQDWNTFMDFAVDNNTPELREDYQAMAFSCMTRNRDNNGNGTIDKDEVRWYLAASQQLLGLMIGNESLSLSARLYQPSAGQWRAHIISSTNFQVMWSEEGGAFGAYSVDAAGSSSVNHTWDSYLEAAEGESVRCLRNIGTYDDNGVVTDVTYAPYNLEIDKYYTLEDDGAADADKHYTFHFDRLDAKSIRDYSAGELPYHEQTSLTNRVYLQFTTQNKTEEVDAYSSTMKNQNPEVTALGYNPYCPEGYRFPNYSEFLMMTLALPYDYFFRDAANNEYSGTIIYPSRTYYDKGYYGSLKSTTEAWSIESDKVGWGAGKNATIHCQETTKVTNRSRCVRDDNMTGYINGEVTLDESYLYPDDWSNVNFNFFSTASALSAASVKLCYTAHSGNYREIDIPVEKSPSGVQYRQTQKVTIPSLASLGLEYSDLPVTMTLETTVRNISGISKTVTNTVQLIHPLKDVTVDFPQKSSSSDGLPVEVSYALGGHNREVSSAVLQWKAPGGAWTDYDITASIGDVAAHSFSSDIYNQTITSHPAITETGGNIGAGKYYNYRFVVTTDDGVSVTSDTKSMEILHFYYDPNPAPDGRWTSANTVAQISKTWTDHVENLDFSDGDRIEVQMNLTNCNYVYKNGNNDVDLGVDNIYAIGLTSINGASNCILWYYPAVENLSSTDPGASRLLIHSGGWTNGKYPLSDLTDLLIVFDGDGFGMNGTRYDNLNVGGWTGTSGVKATLTSADNLYMGSVEGKHHSRAMYPYIRVIRDREIN